MTKWQRVVGVFTAVSTVGSGLVLLVHQVLDLRAKVPGLKQEVDDDFWHHHETIEELEDAVRILMRRVHELERVNLLDPATVPGLEE